MSVQTLRTRVVGLRRRPFLLIGFLLLGLSFVPVLRSAAERSVAPATAVSERNASSGAGAGSKRTAGLSASPFFAPGITATKTGALGTAPGDDVNSNGKINRGDTLLYTVLIGNTGVSPADDATGVNFNDTIDTNTTLVPGSFSASPVALNDTFPVTVTGNVSINSANLASPFSVVTNDYLGANPTATITAFDATSTNGGNVVMTTSGADIGKFTYDPPAGFEGTDTFTYTLTDNAAASSAVANRKATVSLTVSGMIWFINNNAAACIADGCGRLSNPYSTLAAFQAANNGTGNHPADNDNIFVYESAVSYTGGVILRTGQKLIGQDAGSSLSAITGLTPVTGSAALPAMNTGAPASTIINAGGIGIQLGSNNRVEGLTSGTAATAMTGISGASFGTVTVNTVIINTNGPALSLNTGTVAGSGFSSVTAASGINGITLTGVGGTLTVSAGSLSGHSGAAFNVAGGTCAITYSGGITQGNNAALVSISGHSTGTITFNTGTLSATNGTGIQLDNADGTYNFNGTTTLNGGDAGIDILNGSAGTINFNSSTTITNPSGIALNVDGTSAAITGGITLAGSISKNNDGKLVDFFNYDTGTANLSATLSCTSTCDGVEVTNNGSAGTINFTGAATINTGASAAVTLGANTGGTVNFIGGLDIDTTSGAGFTATGGGTVNVCDENPCNAAATGALVNTSTTTTGTALNIANTNIGTNNLEFRNISSNGATNGIILNTTGASGGLKVKGTGTAATGGTIQNTSQSGIFLSSTANVSLSGMNIQNTNEDGIEGLNVAGLNLAQMSITGSGDDAEDTGVGIDNLTGTASWTDVSVTGSEQNNVMIDNSSGTLDSFSISGASHFDSLGTAFGSNSILVEIRGTAVLTSATISGATFQNNKPARGLTVQAQDSGRIGDLPPGSANMFTVQNCTFTNNGLQASFEQAHSANLTFKFINNGTAAVPMTMPNTPVGTSHAVNVFSSSTSTGGTIRGRLAGNYIGNAAVAGSGSAIGNGFRTLIQGRTAATLLYDSNVIRQIPQARGIDIQLLGPLDAVSPNTTHDITVTNNDVNPQDSTGFPQAAIYVAADSQGGPSPNGGSPNTVRADIRGNTVPAGAAVDTFPTFIILDKVVNNAVCQLVDTPPASGTATAQLTSTNTGSASAAPGCTLIAGPINTPPARLPSDDRSLIIMDLLDRNRDLTGQPGWLSRPLNALAAPEIPVGTTQHGSDPVVGAEGFAVGGANSAGITVETSEASVSNQIATLFSAVSRGLFALVDPPTFAQGANRTPLGSPGDVKRPGSGETVSASLGTLPAGKSVTITFKATISTGLGFTQVSNQGTVSGGNFSNVLTDDPGVVGAANPTVNVISAADLTAVKTNNASGTRPLNTAWNWTIAVTNGGTEDAAFTSGQTVFTDSLPDTNIIYGAPTTNNPSVVCALSGAFDLTCTAGASGVTLAGPGGTFNITVPVTGASVAGSYANPRAGGGGCTVDPGALIDEGANEGNNTCSNTVQVFAPPTVVKSFLPTSVAPGGQSTLSIQISNPAANPAPLTGIAFTDAFPAGLVVATPLVQSNSCSGTLQDSGGGVLAAGDTGIRLTASSLNAGASCTVTVKVTPNTGGAKVNNVTVASTEGGNATVASATLTVGKAPLDFDGDGTSDYAVIRDSGLPRPANAFDPSAGTLDQPVDPDPNAVAQYPQRGYYFRQPGERFDPLAPRLDRPSAAMANQLRWLINTSGPGADLNILFGTLADFPVPADYDGDGICDLAVWTGGVGAQFRVLTSSSSFATTVTYTLGDALSDPSVVGDYDGDGKVDPAVVNRNTGQWSYLGGATHASLVTVTPVGTFGGGFPIPGDYDGDGKYDFMLETRDGVNPTMGHFYQWNNTGSLTPPATANFAFGNYRDVVIPGDYDGDGKTDICVASLIVNPVAWRIRLNNGGTLLGPFTLGNPLMDYTITGDYNGDQKAEITIFHPPATTQFQSLLAPGYLTPTTNANWGLPGDYPLAYFNAH